jgi:uncharacterized membrane protein YukC
MNSMRFRNQKGSTMMDYIISAILIVILAWFIYKFFSAPENQNHILPGQDQFNR